MLGAGFSICAAVGRRIFVGGDPSICGAVGRRIFVGCDSFVVAWIYFLGVPKVSIPCVCKFGIPLNT